MQKNKKQDLSIIQPTKFFDKGLYPTVTLYVSLKYMQQAKIKIFSLAYIFPFRSRKKKKKTRFILDISNGSLLFDTIIAYVCSPDAG